MFQVASNYSEDTIVTESAYTPASWTLATNPDVIKFYPVIVAVGLLIEILVTYG
jgi:hypothetical protein